MTATAATTASGSANGSANGDGRGDGRRAPGRSTALLAAIAFLPLLWTSPGRVSADTKSYLTLDPGRLLAKAPSLWDPSVGFGTVTHQTIGYLFPLGPYYWVMQHLAVPDWLTQRLWLGLVFFAAGTGAARLARAFGASESAAVVTAVAYQLSPYVLDYAARISVILLPWAALGWLVWLTMQTLHDHASRWPAMFALVTLAVGGVNATALVLAGLGPLCWLGVEVARGRARVRDALGVVARLAVFTVPVSAWWIVALAVQGRFGIPILRYTETYEAVARTSTAAEVLRGLGYWFFYGQDKVSAWVGPAKPYTQSLPLIVISFVLPALALTSLAAVRGRHRGYAVVLLVAGTTVAVGSHPYHSPSLYGWVFKQLSFTTVGSALRSTPRAVPLVVLATSLALGAGAAAAGDALARRRPARARHVRLAPAVGVCLLVAANLPSLWVGRLLTPSILRGPSVPAYWRDAARAIDGGDHATRVLETPASDFADYRWGGTVDPITPGLVDRGYVARELVPYGSAPGADVLNAFERRVADRIAEPEATAPLLRMLSVGTVLARNDLQYERYRLARPRQSTAALAATPGLTAGASFGTPAANLPIARLPLVDAEELTTPADIPDPAPVTTYDVADARPIVSTAPADAPTIVSADGEGLVDIAAAGLLPDDAPVLSAGDLVARPASTKVVGGTDPHLVLTDTNRLAARRWGSVRENIGFTEPPGLTPLRRDVTDNRLDDFPAADQASASWVEQRGLGPGGVRATGYGNPITYTPEDRPAAALDGDPTTAWRVGAFADVTGERIEVDPPGRTLLQAITLLQPINGARNRWITAVRVSIGGAGREFELDDSSRVAPGQTLDLAGLSGAASGDPISIEIVRTNFTKLPGYRGISAVGFAEITIPGVRIEEVVHLPRDLFDLFPEAAARGQASVVLSRQRASALEPNRDDPERSMTRSFWLTEPREVSMTGIVRLAARASDDVIARLISPDGASAVASARLAGATDTRGQLALDGDPATAWQTPIDGPLQQLTITTPAPVTLDHVALQVRADRRHSVPTKLAISADGGAPVEVVVPSIADGAARDALATASLTFAPLTGSTFVVAVAEVRAMSSIDYFSELPVTQPVAIAELGLGGPGGTITAPVVTSPDTGACRTDLLSVDGRGVPTRLLGSAAALAAGATVPFESCDPTNALDRGTHEVRTAPGITGGLDVDRVVFEFPAFPPPPAGGGGAGDGGAGTQTARRDIPVAGSGRSAAMRPAGAGRVASQAGPSTPSPAVTVVSADRTSYHLSVAPTRATFWLLLGQSRNAGWHAYVDGQDLGPSTLVNGYANGWLLSPNTASATIDVVLRWTPQRIVTRGLVVSLVAAIGCVAVIAVSTRRHRRRHPAVAALVAAGEHRASVRRPPISAPPPVGAPPLPPLPPPAPQDRARDPLFVRPFAPYGFEVKRGLAWVFAVFATGGAVPAALVAVLLVAVPTLGPRLRRAVVLLPAACLALGTAYVVAKQVRYHLPTDLEWPRAFEPAHVLSWCAIAATATLVLLDRGWRAAGADRGPR